MPFERSRSVTVKPTRSSASPTRRHAPVERCRRRRAATRRPRVLSMRAQLRRAAGVVARATAAAAAGSDVPNLIISRVRNSASSSRVRRHHRPGEAGGRRPCRSSSSAPAPCRDARRRSRPCRARCRARCACGTCRACRSCRRRPTNLPTDCAQEVLRNLGAVLGPVGLHDAVRRLLDRQHEAVLAPELARGVPRLLGRRLDDQPALVADARRSARRASAFGAICAA